MNTNNVHESRPRGDASAPWRATPGQVVPGGPRWSQVHEIAD